VFVMQCMELVEMCYIELVEVRARILILSFKIKSQACVRLHHKSKFLFFFEFHSNCF